MAAPGWEICFGEYSIMAEMDESNAPSDVKSRPGKPDSASVSAVRPSRFASANFDLSAMPLWQQSWTALTGSFRHTKQAGLPFVNRYSRKL